MNATEFSMTRKEEGGALDNDPLWYKDAIIYELHVRAFYDSDGDGRGDFAGLTQKLDYLQDLGITAIWLLPYYPSPLKDDGYDIADYTSIHPSYGKLRDFENFLQEAHRRGIRVINELVINHTSDQHPWFKKARRSPPGNPARDFYIWSDTPDRYTEARIIFQDFEPSNWSWDHVAGAYYWHRFFHHQPDLNYDNPEVWEAVKRVADFWLERGVDGMRLDAIPYLYQREGTNCENLPETHVFLKALRKHVDQKYQGRMFLAEANQWPEDSSAYFGEGDECHTAFHFPLMPRLFMAVSMEDRFPILDILEQTPTIPENCQWVVFLRNHDELTLEMVTEEERDAMYRAYARDLEARINLGIRRRLAPLLANNRRTIELLNGLLFSLPGTPVIYYGDEIGMGDNIYLGDRNGVRTPMQWSADRNAGFSRANPQKLYLPVIVDPECHYEAVNVEAQQNNSSSLLWWMKRIIALRKRYKAFGRGSLQFLHPDNHKVLAFLRRYQVGEDEEQRILVVANLSRFAQCVELDLSEFEGLSPIELFGRTEFPQITPHPYFLTLSPHGFCWFALEPRRVPTPEVEAPLPTFTVRGTWDRLLHGTSRHALEEALPGYMRPRRWFGAKTRDIRQTTFREIIPFPASATDGAEGPAAVLTLVQVEYLEGEPDLYVLPLTCVAGPQVEEILADRVHSVVARLRGDIEGILQDAMFHPAFCSALLEMIAGGQTLRGHRGELVGVATEAFAELRAAGEEEENLEPTVSRQEQSNSSVLYGEKFILKVFRRVEEGINPDLEIGHYLTDRQHFEHIPPAAGWLEYSRPHARPVTVGFLQGFVPNAGTGWPFTLDALGRFYDRVLTSPGTDDVSLTSRTLLDLAHREAPEAAQEMIGAYLDVAEMLGERTAQMHLALANEAEDPAFTPEPFTSLYQRSTYQSMRTLTGRVFQGLGKRLRHLPEELRPLSQTVYENQGEILKRFRALVDKKITAQRIRCHGDYHLGQVLYTGKDFVILDFEGEPARSLSDRRLKRSPLRDVAGMIRSFDYACSAALNTQRTGGNGRNGGHGVIRAEDIEKLQPWARFWYLWVSAAFLKAYLRETAKAPFLPQARDELQVLLDALLLEKAVYELGYELDHRPDWVRVPMQGILHLLGAGG
jgi:maltose alpha-D-glucosyltransferase/alpha-amylase